MIDDKLPQPDPEALEHSRRLQAVLMQEYNDLGHLPFSRFMQLALYAPGLGYYSAGNTKIGADGDFVTAPETSSLFAECIAEQIIEAFDMAEPTVLEFGAGTGRLALDILRSLNSRNSDPDNYWILETSADLTERQQRLLRDELPADLFAKVVWLTCLPETFSGVVIANEVLDAMPVECIEIGESSRHFRQRFVTPMPAHVASDDNLGSWSDHWQTASESVTDACRGRLADLVDYLPTGYRTELNLHLGAWFASLSQSLNRGLVLIVDYGYPRCELYAPDRVQGTLRCYYRHRLHDDPYLYPGLQDITADVDFTLVVETATEAGFELHGYTSQAQFLLANGLTEKADSRLRTLNSEADRERFLISQQVNTLSMASAMGERFQVMGLSKGLEPPLRGFQTLDLSHRL